MGKNQWENLGEDILNSVFEAADTGDFSNLSRNVENLVNVTFDKVGSAVRDGIQQAKTQTQSTYEKQKQAGAEYYKKWQEQQKRQQQNWQQPMGNQQQLQAGQQGASLRRNTNQAQNNQYPVLYRKNVPGKYAGPLLTVFGGIGIGIFGLGTIGFGIAGLVTASLGTFITSGIFAAITAGFIVMTGSGNKISRRNKRFRQYVRCLGSKSYCKIEDMAMQVGKPLKFVKKDLRKMLSMGYFLQGHIDRDETTMIASHEVYQQYTQAELARIQREEEEKTPKSEVDQLVAEGQRYIAHIHECNDAIPGEEISA